MNDSNGFETELDRARGLLEADDLTAVHVGVIHDDRTVDTVASRRTGNSEEELQALSLLATHVRAVAAEAGVDYETVAADAAAVAAQLEELPIESPPDSDVDGENTDSDVDGDSNGENTDSDVDGDSNGDTAA